MLEALWSVEFKSNLHMVGTGIVVLETGRVLGGDSSMIYIGNYHVEDGVIHTEIKVDKYANAPGMASIVGLNSFTFVAMGKTDEKTMEIHGYVKERQEIKVSCRLTRRGELPNPA